ncbi:Uncharacterised protein [Mycobacteroides abscessus subsp. massiliense]|nr:Uncharacterised protein [Mycobacteroides abscessus subsp. massiliense]
MMRGHQNSGPRSRAIAGVMNDRTMSVSSSRPSPIMDPSWPTDNRSLESMAIIVVANTMPAVVTTLPELATALIKPVFSPALLSSR